jgi:hypothetical protein
MTQEDVDLFLESVDIGYTRCNVQPTSGTFFKRCTNAVMGCGITAALINKNGIDMCNEESVLTFRRTVQQEFNLSELFVMGFIFGFDGNITGSKPDDPDDYSKGYYCGQKKRKKWITSGRGY